MANSSVWNSPITNDVPPRQPVYKRPPTGAPVSLGILLEASRLSRSSRDALVQGLTEVLDQLRQGDEAFILTFSDDVAFEQDLTHSPWLLQDAIMKLKPRSGAGALYTAITTASGHLRRIARNPNRVLVLVSDGDNGSRPKNALQLGWSIRDVTIHCVGVDVRSETDREFLQKLAARTGGQALFVDDASAFPTISQSMAQGIYGK